MRHSVVFLLAAIATVFFSAAAFGGDTLTWNTNQNRVTADIQSVELRPLLEAVARTTGWQVYLESNTTRTVSAKFRELAPGDALRLLLGNLNFAVVPQTNARSRLYVFRTVQGNATQLIQPGDGKSGGDRARAIPNELVVTLKPGAKIEDIDCARTAKVTGRIEGLNVYRLHFDAEADTKAAEDCLRRNSQVASVDSNFPMDHPEPTQMAENFSAPDFNLKQRDPGDCKVIIGLIDTGVRPLGNDLDNFVLPSVSVADSSGCPPPGNLTHGPAMAETILRSLQTSSGGKTSVKILPVDVYGCNESTTTFDVTTGIYKAVNAGANIINLSLGSSGDSTTLHTLIQDASKQGVVFFGAAGNQPVTSATYPAAYSEVIAVTAGDRPGQIASYANRGDFVDIMAPGTSVVPYNGQAYAVSGTSTATAFASGLAAGLADSSQDCPDKVIPTIRSKLGVNFTGHQ